MQFPAHVEWIADHMGPALKSVVHCQGFELTERYVLAVLCHADPSPRKRAVQWLAERLLDGGFLWEDVCSGAGSKVHETLTSFKAHRRALVGAERHLAAYPTLASVWNAIAHLVPRQGDDLHEPGIRERRRLERATARAESTILCERPGLTVAVPLTEQAAKWWGRGTRWCTAADKDNAFEAYNAHGPLIVVVLPNNKLQLFIEPRGNVQFMDESDAGVTPDFVSRHWREIGPLIVWATRQTAAMVGMVPHAMRDRDMWMAAVSHCMHDLKNVPLEMRDRDMCMAAVSHNGDSLIHVPRNLVDREMSLLAVTVYGWAMNVVPRKFMGHEMRLAAVRQNGMALKAVPRIHRNRELCLAAVGEFGFALEFVPKWLRNREMYRTAVARHGGSMEFVPARFRDKEMYLLAVTSNGSLLSEVPEHMRDREMCMAATQGSYNALNLIPKDMHDREMYMAAVTAHPTAIAYVPPAFRDREMYMAAVTGGNGFFLDSVPPRMQDREMCLAALANDPGMLWAVPSALQDVDLCVAAVSRRRSVIRFVPDGIRDQVLILAGQDNRPDLRDSLEDLRQALAADDTPPWQVSLGNGSGAATA